MNEGVKGYTRDGEPIVTFYSARREGDKLVTDVMVLDSMRMDIIFTLKEVLGIVKMTLSWGVISYILLIPYFSLKRLFSRAKVEGEQQTIAPK